MRLIEQYGDISRAEYVAEKLRRRGILTHISSKRSFNLSRVTTGALNVGLWTVLDFQYDDACAVLRNSKHEVTSGLDEEEITQLEFKTQELSTKFFNKILIKLGFLIVTFLCALLYYML